MVEVNEARRGDSARGDLAWKLSSLISRVEKATGPNYALEVDIFKMLAALQAVEESAVILGDDEVVSKEAMILVRAAITAAAHMHSSTGANLYLSAASAISAFEDWAHINEAEWSGWGDMIVPPMATFWRVKAGQAMAALRECVSICPIAGDNIDSCPICAEPLLDDDICATDIEMGICHAACLEGSPTVDLETGDEVEGPIDTFRYGDTAPKTIGGDHG